MENEKLRNLHGGKIDLPCGLGSSGALESFLHAELMLLRLVSGRTGKRGLVHSFFENTDL